MERNRESRRRTSSVITGSYSSSRRRSRSIGFRESSSGCDAEDGGNDSVRDRSNGKMERPSRRRRLNSNERYHVDRDEENGSSEESLDDDENGELDEHDRGSGSRGGSSRIIDRTKRQWKGSDVVIGVSVPRRTRSASAKKFQDSFPTVRQFSSSSPLRTSAAATSLPSTNVSMKATRKMESAKIKTKPLKTSKVSISESEVEVAQFLTRLQSHQPSANEGSVVVTSKALSPDLTPVCSPSSQPVIMPQRSSSISATVTVPKRKKPRTVQIEDGDNSAMMACSSKPPVCRNSGDTSIGLIPAVSPKTEGVKDLPATKAEVSSPKLDKNSLSNNGSYSKPESSFPVSSLSQTSLPGDISLSEDNPNTLSSVELKTLMSPEKNLQSIVAPTTEDNGTSENLQASVDWNDHVVVKKSSLTCQDIHTSLLSDVKLDPPNITSPVSAAAEGSRVVKFEIDLMAPPDISGLDHDLLDEADKSAIQESSHNLDPVVGETATKTEVITNTEGKVEADEARQKHYLNILGLEENFQVKEASKVADLDKQLYNERSGSLNVNDENKLDLCDNTQPSQKLSNNTAKRSDITVMHMPIRLYYPTNGSPRGGSPAPKIIPMDDLNHHKVYFSLTMFDAHWVLLDGPSIGIMTSTSNPTPITFPSWPGGLPSFGYLGSSPPNLSGMRSLPPTRPIEGNSVNLNPPFLKLPLARPSRSATHCFIAQLIRHQQQIARFNPFWHAEGSATLYGAKPYSLNMLPPSEALLFGAGSIMRNPNMVPSSSLAPGSVVTLNGCNSTEKVSNSVTDSQRKHPQLPQSAQQKEQGFNFPAMQSTTGAKSHHEAENAGLIFGSGCATGAPSATASINFSNIVATSDPQYQAMLHSNYPFPIPPAYRVHMIQQQHPGAPFFGSSLYPPHPLQLQSHSFPHIHTQNPTSLSRSLSTQKCLQAQKNGITTSKSPFEFCHTENEPIQNQGGSSESQVLSTQKNLPGQNITKTPSFHQKLATMPAALGEKQQQQKQQTSDPIVQMGSKSVETTIASVPSGYPLLQTMPNLGCHQYQLSGGHIQIQAANKLKAPAKYAPAANGSDKFPEPRHAHSITVAAQQQLQKQAMAQTLPVATDVSITSVSSGMGYTDYIPVGHPSSGANFPAGSVHFPQLKTPPSQRATPGGSQGNLILQSAMSVAAVETPNTGSLVPKELKLASPSVNPILKMNSAVYSHSLGGGSVAVMAAASYAHSAEQKPAPA